MSLELGYGETTTSVTGGTGADPFIDLGTLTLGDTGEISCECFCPLGNMQGVLGGQAITFVADIGGIDLGLLAMIATVTADEDAAVYGQASTIIDVSGGHDFEVKLKVQFGTTGQAVLCADPLVPAWFRVIGEPFTPPEPPPVDVPFVTIHHTFGLGE